MLNMSKRNVFVWALYDFANSIVTIVFFLYFSQWLVVDKGVSDFWYNMTFTIGSLLLLVTAPVLGSIADKTGRHQKYLNPITILVFLFFLGAALITLFQSQMVFLAILFFLIANYLYQFSFVFYNALLHRIAPPRKWGIVSGIGQAGNWSGEIVGLLISLPLASGAIYIIGEAGRAQTLLPATVIFLVLALPMLLFLKLPKQERIVSHVSLKGEYKNQWNQFKELLKAPSMKLFLLSYFFFNDAVITASNNFPIYLENVYAVSDRVKAILLISITLTALFGALGAGWMADKIGIKKMLTIILGSWIAVFPLLGFAPNFSFFVVCVILMGFLFGGVATVSRAAMTALCPPSKLNFGFSFYTISERVATLLGPLAWGLITSLLVDLGSVRYRIAAIFMAVFIIIGFCLMRKVEIKETENEMTLACSAKGRRDNKKKSTEL